MKMCSLDRFPSYSVVACMIFISLYSPCTAPVFNAMTIAVAIAVAMQTGSGRFAQ